TAKKTSLSQKTLVASQACLSLVLLSAAVMLSQSLHNLEHQSFGFETRDRYVVWIDPAISGYQAEPLASLYPRLPERLQAIPGVHGVSMASYAPMSGDSWNNSIRVEGKPEPHSGDNSDALFARIMPGFFETLKVPMTMGRTITEEDSSSSRHVALINEA